MIILDKPYVSDVLLKTVEKLQEPVLANEMLEEVGKDYKLNQYSEKKFIQSYKSGQKIYTNSENSLDWLYRNIEEDEKIRTIQKFKDKAAFRKMVQEIYPDFYYETFLYKELRNVDLEQMEFPFVLKPNQGFFSLGVYIIYTKEDWEKALEEIDGLVKEENVFNEEVISHAEYIIEEYVQGEEYAIDGYYDEQGKVVILNVLKHVFASETDVLDRLYITSPEIIQTYMEPLRVILEKVNQDQAIKNFPFHFEVKIDGERTVPIEMNPMRFAGWCTTDIGYYAYGNNNYVHFFENTEPEWASIYERCLGNTYAMVIMEKTNPDVGEKEFDYTSLQEEYEEILECRKVDYHEHSIYGFLFLKITVNHEKEFDKILHEDFDRFLKVKSG